MNYELLMLLLLILLTICFIFLVRSLLEVKGWEYKFEMRVKEWLEREERNIREDAIKRSALTRSGKALEKLCPFLTNFGYDPHDVRWLGETLWISSYSMDTQKVIELERVCDKSYSSK